MIVSSSRPMGVKLLQQMGWKEGQGIGSRKKRKMRDGKDLLIDLEGLKGLPAEVISGGEILLSAVDEISGKFSEIPKPKVDKYGIGFNQTNQNFSGMGSGRDLISFSRWNTPSIDPKIGSGSYRVGDIFSNTSHPSHSNFENNNLAVGKLSRNIDRDNGGFALDDDEDDVYENSHASVDYSHISTYSQPISKLHNEVQLSFQQQKDVPLLAIAAETTRAAASVQSRCKTDNKLPLPGFHVSEQYLHCTPATDASRNGHPSSEQSSRGEFQMIYFPPPVVPRDFQEKHDFLKDRYLQSTRREEILIPTDSRGTEGNEETKPLPKGRLYEMLDAKGKEQIKRALALQSNASETSSKLSLPLTNEQSPVTSNPPPPSFAAPGLAEALKGRFMSSSVTQPTIPAGLSAPQGGLVTAQDFEQERKLKEEKELKLKPPQDGPLLLKSIRRTTTIWAPNRLLCKRMNVPVPQITTEKLLAIASQGGAASNHGREAEIFEKHIEKHISSNSSFLQLPSTDESEALLSSSSTIPSGDGSKAGGVKKIGTVGGGVSGGDGVFHLEKNIDPTTGIFIPEIKPQLSLLKSIFDDSESDSDSEEEEEEEEKEEQEKVDPSPSSVTPPEIPQSEGTKSLSGLVPLPQRQSDEVVQEVKTAGEEVVAKVPVQEDDTKLVFRKPTSRGMTQSRVTVGGGSSRSKPKPTIISFDDEESEHEDNAKDFNLHDLRSRREDALKSIKKSSVAPPPPPAAPVAITPPSSSPITALHTPVVLSKENQTRSGILLSQHPRGQQSSQSNQKTLERLKRSLQAPSQQSLSDEEARVGVEMVTTRVIGSKSSRSEREQEQGVSEEEEEEERKRQKKSSKKKSKSKKSKKEHKAKSSKKKKKKASKSERGEDRKRSKGSSTSSSMSSSDGDDSS
jgi:hypothetical protein